MPLTKKGLKIRAAMEEYYGKEKGEEVFYAAMEKYYGKEKGDEVFYASENAGKIKGVKKKTKKDK